MSDSHGLETAIGVISGTSMDGIDVALIESDGEAELKTGPAATFPYPPEIARRLRAVVADLSEAQAPQLELERFVTNFLFPANRSRSLACTARPFCIGRDKG